MSLNQNRVYLATFGPKSVNTKTENESHARTPAIGGFNSKMSGTHNLILFTLSINYFRTAVPFWGHITYTCPQNGTAVLKGLLLIIAFKLILAIFEPTQRPYAPHTYTAVFYLRMYALRSPSVAIIVYKLCTTYVRTYVRTCTHLCLCMYADFTFSSSGL